MSLFSTCMNVLLIGLTSIIALGMFIVIIIMFSKVIEIIKALFK